MSKDKPGVPKTNLGVNVPIIGEGNIPKEIQQLIIAMFQEYVLPEFTKFNVVLEALAGRMEKLENDRRFTIDLSDELKELIAVKLLGTGYKTSLREAKEEE